MDSKELMTELEMPSLRDKGETHVRGLETSIRACGLTFKIWRPKDGKGGRSKDSFEWTSLRGNDKRKLLKNMPSKIPELLPGIERERLKDLWMDFQDILNIIGNANPSIEEIDELETQTKSWLTSFLSLSTSLEGHQKANVTPYMHILAQHIPTQMKAVRGIKRFSGQPVEKNNDDARRNYFSSNRHDPAMEILLSDARAELLSSKGCERKARVYTKRNDDYWRKTIYEQRSSQQD